MRRRFFVIHNPAAGVGRQRRLGKILDGLRKRGCRVIVRHAESLAENRALAQSAVQTGNFDAVIAAGGDGTIRGAALALLGTGMPLGIIPIGTGNVLAREIGLRLHTGAIIDCLLEGQVASVPAAIANGQPFLLMAGIGFDGRVIGWLDAGLKRRVGKLGYLWPIIKGFSRRARRPACSLRWRCSPFGFMGGCDHGAPLCGWLCPGAPGAIGRANPSGGSIQG